jgi:hypothetical protein
MGKAHRESTARYCQCEGEGKMHKVSIMAFVVMIGSILYFVIDWNRFLGGVWMLSRYAW